MEALIPMLSCIGIMLVMLAVGLPIAYSVGISAMAVGFFTYGPAAMEKLGWSTFQTLYNPSWTALPLFTFLGYIIAETKIGEDLFVAARLWLNRVPGGLIVASIMAQAAIGAPLGSSGATILCIGPVAMPELDKFNYDRKLSLGALTCGGVLGPLIPPSTTAIIISALAGECIPLGQLLVAGTIPGLLLALMLASVPIFKTWRDPSLAPSIGKVNWKDRIISLKKVWSVIVIFAAIMGSIFFGIATATEAGGVGAFFVLVIAVVFYKYRWKELYRSMIATVKVNAAILFIIIGASFFSYIVGSVSISKQLISWVQVFGTNPLVVVICMQFLLLILGTMIDGMTMMAITIPIYVPLVVSMGLNPIWFAVLYEVNMEIALITPPMAMNFFLVKNVFKISSSDLLKGLMPYLLVLIVFLFIIVAFPSLSTWLPELMVGP
ncbi:MAG: TRAP transporter large permease [Spirochaetes bacterium]|nr:TRAP transporter large permease [Spirochaetota bacterium]